MKGKSMLKKWMLVLAICLLPQMAFAGKEYDECYQKIKNDDDAALCMKAETARILKVIQEIYVNVSKNELTASWNKGNGLLNGNLKDMYDHFIAYRNRYCSLFVVASQNTFGSSSFDKERCLLQLTDDHYKLMLDVITNANSGPEEDESDPGHHHD